MTSDKKKTKNRPFWPKRSFKRPRSFKKDPFWHTAKLTFDFSELDPLFDALDKLKRSDTIQVTFPKQSLGILVKKSPACTVTALEIKDTPFLAVFSHFA